MLKCESSDHVQELVAQVYTDHCTDRTDAVVVKALVETLARYSALPVEEVSSSFNNCNYLLGPRMEAYSF